MIRLVKIAVTCILMGVLLWIVDWQQMTALLVGLHWSVVALLYGVLIFELVLSTVKWSSALRMHGIHHRFGFLFRTLCTGYFFNNFLPTAVGGDAYRAYRTLPNDGYRSRAVSAILVERLTGFAALLTLGAVGGVLLFDQSPVARSYVVLFVAGSVAGLAVLGALFAGWLRGLVERFTHLKAVDALLHNAGRLARARRGWIEQVVISFAFQAISIGIVYWLFSITGESVGFWECALITAAVGLAAFLPLSIAGIGLMEGSLVAMAVAFGIGYEPAVFVALARRMLMLALSMFCGLVYLVDSHLDAATAEAARGRLDVGRGPSPGEAAN